MIRAALLMFSLCGFSPFLLAQSCVDSITPTTDSRDFTLNDNKLSDNKLNDNATITHRNSKTMWSRCALGQNWEAGKCTGEPVLKTWNEAQQLANASHLHSFTDWRLPSIHELSGITELSCQNPAINLSIFPNAPSVSFWAATEFVNDKKLAWQVFFGSGENHTAKKTIPAAIRLVRSVKDNEEM